MAAVSDRFADLRTRVIWGAIVAVLALVCIWLGGIWIACLMSFAAAAMMAEWRLITSRGNAGAVRSGIIYLLAVGALPLIFFFTDAQTGYAVMVALVILGVVIDRARGETSLGRWCVLGAFYIGTAALAFVWLRAAEPYGFLSILWAALVVVATDIGGYFAGRTIGGPKLWPAVSPKKTWAGLGGGVAFAFVTGGLFSWATTGTYFVQVCAVSAVAAVLAQAGDLGESALKRHFGVKDASSLIPGHGGVLDRLDGHMAAILVAAAVTFWRGEAVFVW